MSVRYFCDVCGVELPEIIGDRTELVQGTDFNGDPIAILIGIKAGCQPESERLLPDGEPRGLDCSFSTRQGQICEACLFAALKRSIWYYQQQEKEDE